MDRVSTGSGSDLVSDQHAIIPSDSWFHDLTRSLSLPVLTRSKNNFGLLRQSIVTPKIYAPAEFRGWTLRAAESVAEYARHSPFTIFKLPQICKVSDAIQFLFLSWLRQVEAMLADRQRSILIDRVNLQRSFN